MKFLWLKAFLPSLLLASAATAQSPLWSVEGQAACFRKRSGRTEFHGIHTSLKR
jgi:hypothetical protein